MSPIGVRWLSALEGGSYLKAYQDNKGVWTIGIGLTYWPESREPVREGDVISSKDEANRLFSMVLSEFEECVGNNVYQNEKLIRNGGPLPAHITDPLISFCFNIGKEAFKNSTALKRFNSNFPFKSVSEAMCWWKHPNLLSRRKAEERCFLQGIYSDQSGRLVK